MKTYNPESVCNFTWVFMENSGSLCSSDLSYWIILIRKSEWKLQNMRAGMSKWYHLILRQSLLLDKTWNGWVIREGVAGHDSKPYIRSAFIFYLTTWSNSMKIRVNDQPRHNFWMIKCCTLAVLPIFFIEWR